MAEKSIEQRAADLVDRYGDHAPLHAAASADALLAAGHFYLEIWSDWKRIEQAVEKMLARRRGKLTGKPSAQPHLIDHPRLGKLRLTIAENGPATDV